MNSDLINLSVKNVTTGDAIALKVKSSAAVKEIRIKTRYESEGCRLILVFDGKRLDDDFTLSYYNILDNSSKIWCHLKRSA